MMRRYVAGILLSFIALGVVSLAQGSGSVERSSPPSRGAHDAIPDVPFVVTRTVSGRIVEVNLDEHSIIVETKDGQFFKFGIDKKAKLKADKGTELGGKKSLLLADFLNGQLVKVTYIPAEKRVTEVRIRREKS